MSKIKLLLPIGYFVASLVYFNSTFFSQIVETNHVVGATITIMAFGFWIIARLQLGNAFSLAPNAKVLVSNGIYSKLRHPIYYFSILVVFGLAIFSKQVTVWVCLVVLVLLEAVRVQKEEKLLLKKFGSEYISYKEKTWF